MENMNIKEKALSVVTLVAMNPGVRVSEIKKLAFDDESGFKNFKVTINRMLGGEYLITTRGCKATAKLNISLEEAQERINKYDPNANRREAIHIIKTKKKAEKEEKEEENFIKIYDEAEEEMNSSEKTFEAIKEFLNNVENKTVNDLKDICKRADEFNIKEFIISKYDEKRKKEIEDLKSKYLR